MIDKKTFVLAVAVSWILTLVTVLFVSNLAEFLTQPFTQQYTESNSVKAISFSKMEVHNISEPFPSGLNLKRLVIDFTWEPTNQNKNAILGLMFSFDYTCDDLSASFWENELARGLLNLNYVVQVKNQHIINGLIEKGAQNQTEWNQQWSSQWETAQIQTTLNTDENTDIFFNQNEYSLQIVFSIGFGAGPNPIPTYVRNVNLTLLVIDG